MTIDVGSLPLDRGGNFAANYTFIVKENPANAPGTITMVQIWANVAITNLQIGIFTEVSPNRFTTRSNVFLGNVPIGYSEHAVSLAVETGDFIGAYNQTGYIAYNSVPEGVWYASGDWVPCTDRAFSFYANVTLSIYGTGPPPAPPLKHFFVKTYQPTRILHGFELVFTTDVDCHMWLRRTDKYPQEHTVPRLRRGIHIFDDKRFCFVSYDDLEQEEAGDTLTHTFIWTGWDFCTWKYFYLWATNSGEPMLSTSPIFHLHYPPGTPPFETDERSKESNFNRGFCQYWNAISQTFTPDHDFSLHNLSLQLNQMGTDRRGPYIVKITKVIGSCWAEPVIAAQQGYSTELPADGVKQWTDYHSLKCQLYKDETYRIVVHTLPGWEAWDGENWVPSEASAALYWWEQSTGNPYPGGSRWYGCNLRDQSGSWLLAADTDHTFILWDMCKKG